MIAQVFMPVTVKRSPGFTRQDLENQQMLLNTNCETALEALNQHFNNGLRVMSYNLLDINEVEGVLYILHKQDLIPPPSGG